MLSLSDDDGENEQLVDQFKEKLHQWKQQYTRPRRATSAIRPSSNVTAISVESYTKRMTLSTEQIGASSKFFHNPSFRTRFQQYLFSVHHIDCQIQFLESQEIYLTLNGQKANVKAARETINNFFQSIQTKIYENEETDRQSDYFRSIDSPHFIFYFQ